MKSKLTEFLIFSQNDKNKLKNLENTAIDVNSKQHHFPDVRGRGDGQIWQKD